MKKTFFILSICIAAMLSATAQTNTLGVGISNPVGTLHVHTTDGYYDPIAPGVDPGNREDIFFDYYQTIFHITNTLTGTTPVDGFTIDQYDGMVTIHQYENSPLHLLGSSNKGLTLLPNGNIGIGTTQPEAPLHVDGNVKATHLSTGGHVSFCTNSQPLTIGMAHTAELGFGSTYIGFNAEKTGSTWTRRNNTWLNGGAVIWATMEGDLLFANLPSTGGGNVTGISDEDIMSSVNMKLSADGVLMAKEVKVALDGWPDYVFSEGFRLMSLPETESYIRENGHLPDIPSASTVESEGLSLGEMNRLLIQKVEELTLHLIELQKQVDELKNK